jgi:hypothetical protein
MIYKEILNDELYVYIIQNGKAELLYKRWLIYDYGVVFCIHGTFKIK